MAIVWYYRIAWLNFTWSSGTEYNLASCMREVISILSIRILAIDIADTKEIKLVYMLCIAYLLVQFTDFSVSPLHIPAGHSSSDTDQVHLVQYQNKTCFTVSALLITCTDNTDVLVCLTIVPPLFTWHGTNTLEIHGLSSTSDWYTRTAWGETVWDMALKKQRKEAFLLWFHRTTQQY